MNAIDKPELAIEILEKYLPLMYIIIWKLLNKANIPIKRFDPEEGVIDFDYKDGFTHRWYLTNTIAGIISKDIYDNPMKLDEQMSDPIYAQCKIFNVIETTIYLIEAAENLDDSVIVYKSPNEQYIREISDIVKTNWS